MTQVLTKGFYAKDDAMTPVKVAILCVALNFVLNITLIWTPLGTSGLAWSTAICAIIQVSLLMILIRKHVSNSVDSEVIRSWCSTALLTLVMSGVVALVTAQWWDASKDWYHALFVLLGAVGAGIIVYGIGSLLLRKPELHWILGRQR